MVRHFIPNAVSDDRASGPAIGYGARSLRAIGIVRQSRSREESLSPAEQRERIEAVCKRESFDLLTVYEEIDVSGGTPLARRQGLRATVEAIERGEAQVVVVAYFDRLFRSIAVQSEVVRRIEEAGGRILAADIGEVSEATPAKWISGAMLGVVSEYYRRSVKERSGAGQALAVEQGIFPAVPPLGYVRGEGGVLEVDAELAPAIREAFALRAQGATFEEVRRFLAEQGIERPYRTVQGMFRSRVYLGEIRFGKLANPSAHEAIVDRATWEACQRRIRGRSAEGTPRMLSRLGILRCASCGGNMSVNNQRTYSVYRCGAKPGVCPAGVSIMAPLVEDYVVAVVKAVLADVRGRASAEADARDAEAGLAVAQEQLDSALRSFAEFGDEPAAVERLRELRTARDAAAERVHRLGGATPSLTVSVEDWHRLTIEARRGLIRATIEHVDVARGRGTDRITVHLLRE